ncbi:hypothetical protein GCM10022422_01450 [Flavobacterium ginsengisoli]|uniref:Uncharacterized protein n=1 Tax=Flavobacterium ginsengisoli TaxID=871694 RepID=A0ABP7ESU0_9FLAO
MKENRTKIIDEICTDKKKDEHSARLFSLFFTLFSYLSKANLLATSVQLITLKKASI